jgi:hypothetical protein
LLAPERAVRIDVELALVADRLARRVEPLRVALRLARDLHLHAGNSLFDPAGELVADAVE